MSMHMVTTFILEESHETTMQNRTFIQSISKRISRRTYDERSSKHSRNIQQNSFWAVAFRSDQKHQSRKELPHP